MLKPKQTTQRYRLINMFSAINEEPDLDSADWGLTINQLFKELTSLKEFSRIRIVPDETEIRTALRGKIFN